MQFRKHTLDNGLEIVAECNPHAYSMALGFFVKTGSRDETGKNHGVSHYLEHMTFKGTPTRSAADVNRELDEIGSHANAFTSEEQTVYYAAFLPEYQDKAVELLGDILRPSLRGDDFDMEKKVILEEIAKYEDQPPFGAHEKCMAAHFGSHPLGRSVLGTTASVGALSREQMLDYFQQRYSPRNIAVVAAGNVDYDRLVSLTDKCCGSWEPFDAPRETPRADAHTSVEVIQKEAANQQYVVQIANGPAVEDDDRYAGRILATVLGDDSGSRLFWELIDTGLAECAAMGAYEYQGTGVYMTYLCCAPEDTADNLELIAKIMREAETAGITEDELAQAKSKILSHIVLQSERPGNRMFSVGSNWLQRREYRTVREILDSYEAVTVRDVVAVLEKYPLTANTTVAVGPMPHLPDA
ncbi:MAG: insulinase family protein [Planctomycetes bacterium]|nr:insulinase family protein [Planctomycetota bacterium]MBL7040455.1 insulinase family protein [Pirellulaceae bacterium]